ncbi:hypothetical protein EYF80_010508 [Liparis tanakae]|uniref:Uncharacterized protein n=1 Tax=Liparis tanakae TaxID=230148 RepID=A0A4Z2IQ17_9TELE|nr:hypothetical protein EYF80_010508 [Liparis tanakae]
MLSLPIHSWELKAIKLLQMSRHWRKETCSAVRPGGISSVPAPSTACAPSATGRWKLEEGQCFESNLGFVVLVSRRQQPVKRTVWKRAGLIRDVCSRLTDTHSAIGSSSPVSSTFTMSLYSCPTVTTCD